MNFIRVAVTVLDIILVIIWFSVRKKTEKSDLAVDMFIYLLFVLNILLMWK